MPALKNLACWYASLVRELINHGTDLNGDKILSHFHLLSPYFLQFCPNCQAEVSKHSRVQYRKIWILMCFISSDIDPFNYTHINNRICLDHLNFKECIPSFCCKLVIFPSNRQFNQINQSVLLIRSCSGSGLKMSSTKISSSIPVQQR